MTFRFLARSAAMFFAFVALVFAGCGGGGSEDAGSGTGSAGEHATHGAADASHGGAPNPDGGSVEGVVRWEGEIPAAAKKEWALSGCPECALVHDGPMLSNALIQDADGHLANVYVYVDGPWEMDPPDTPAVLDQLGCRYSPKMIGIQCDQVLRIKNSDKGINHNVHIYGMNNEEDNIGMSGSSEPRERSYPNAESRPMKFLCDLHPWMGAWVGVLSHPYFAVTDTSGSFHIEGVPEGEWDLVLWHEIGLKQKRKITVSKGGSVELSDLVFKPRS